MGDTEARPGRLRFLENQVFDRIFSVLALVPAGALLTIAARLDPDPAGMGTHRQMGLGPCSFLTWTGWPCPTCGMTTTFSLAADGRLLDAFINQPFGLVLFLVDVAIVVVAILELVAPRRRWRRLFAWVMDREGWASLAILIGMMCGWAVRLVHFVGGR